MAANWTAQGMHEALRRGHLAWPYHKTPGSCLNHSGAEDLHCMIQTAHTTQLTFCNCRHKRIQQQ